MNALTRLMLPATRRHWAIRTGKLLGTASASFVLNDWLSTGGAAESIEPLNRYPRMLHDWYADQIARSQQKHIDAIDRIQNKQDAVRYIETVQNKIRACFGPEPERTPLNAKTTGVVKRDGYHIEKVIFESRPKFSVTANLYLPTNTEGPFPE